MASSDQGSDKQNKGSPTPNPERDERGLASGGGQASESGMDSDSLEEDRGRASSGQTDRDSGMGQPSDHGSASPGGRSGTQGASWGGLGSGGSSGSQSGRER